MEMRRNLSLYIDIMRVGAAFSVFLGHARMETLSSIPAIFGIHFSEAVAVFFVLSGFVIRYVTSRSETDWKSYTLARIIRIVPVVLLAIVVTYTFDIAGFLMNSEYYAHVGITDVSFSLFNLMSVMTFTNEFWMLDAYVGTNHAIWSIGYEVLYYVMFGLAFFFDGRRRAIAILVVASLCGPKIMLYFPLWLIGVAAFEIVSSNKIVLGERISLIIFLLSFVTYAVVKKNFGQSIGAMFIWQGFDISIPTSIYFDVIGFIVAVNIIAFDSATRRISVFGNKAARIIRWVSGATFTMYLTHGPILLFLTAVLTSLRPGILSRTLAVMLTLALVFVFAELAERRKRQATRLVWGLNSRLAAYVSSEQAPNTKSS